MRLVTTLIVFAVVGNAQTVPFHWRGSVAQGRAIEVRSINGDVFAEGYDGSEVEVVANIASESGITTPVRVQAIENERGVTVCAVYETRDGESRECLNDPAAQKKTNGPRVNFAVRVPHGVSVIGRTVNGTVDAQRLDSDVEAYTVNGKIFISTQGSAQARTINGSIFASLGNPFWRKRGDFSTVNGSITLNLPACASTHVQADTINGRVSTAFRLRNSGNLSEKSLRGSIGTGASILKVKTVNGSIQLKKAT
jgi:hypothetical protein